MINFNTDMSQQEHEELIKTSVFWEMQTAEANLKTMELSSVVRMIAKLEYFKLVKNYSLFTCDLVNACATWEDYCVKALGRTLQCVELELTDLEHAYKRFKALNIETAIKDEALINATRPFCTLKALAKDLLNVQASA